MSAREQWSSRTAFVLAAVGATVGIGNIWRFPYLVGEYGGAAFILVYLGCLAVFGLPLMIAEVAIGRRSRLNPVHGFRYLATETSGSPAWLLAGLMGIVATLCILPLYSVVAGWTMAYLVRTASGILVGVTGDGARSIFNALISDPEKLFGWHTLFIVSLTLVAARGVRQGLERAVRVLVPGLFLILLSLLAYSWGGDALQRALDFMLAADFEAVTMAGMLAAMSQAFFTLSLGMGALMIYGSYLPGDASIIRSTASVVLIDTLMAIMAVLAVFPIVFSSGLSVAEGPGLVFQTLPVAFGRMGGGMILGSAFFLLLLFAAWSSGLSLMEPAVAWLVESGVLGRGWAAVVVGLIVWLLGIGVVMSFSAWSFEFTFADEVRTGGLFDVLDILSASILLPLGGLAVALFAGRTLSRKLMAEEIGGGEGLGFWVWYGLIKYVVPVGVVVILLRAVGGI
ncbi:MAG: sodium-dependent transporter [Gammaproteobacteria bacterium]|nr:sodium-dependent transporter [Gammaproteobacteria bacterium]